jgi:hypothetical protein
MKKCEFSIMLYALLSSFFVMAQTGPTGVWQSNLDTGAGEKLSLQFVINKLTGGAYSITVHYVDQGTVKNLSATSVSFEDRKLAFNVEDLGGSYSGTLDNKTITGEWRRGNNAVPMILTPYKRPEPSSRDIAKVLGHWVGKVTYPDGLLITGVCRFEKTAGGKLAGFANSPDSGGVDTPITDILIEGNQLRFRIPAIQAEYTGELTPEGIVGNLRAPGNYESAWNMVKGEYRPSIIRLDIPSEEMKKLLGRWVGKLGTVSVVFRFEQNSGGESTGFIDIPEQNVKGMRIFKASLIDGSLFLKTMGMEYTGKMAGSKIDGAVTPMGQNPIPLVLIKE